jgi:Ser/Thr protein kinase RdoA (MazF antagonist)
MPYLRDNSFTSSQLSEIASIFQLGEIEDIISDLEGRFCLVTAVKTIRGQFVIRLLYQQTTCERIKFVHQVFSKLLKDGFPVPEVRTTIAGEDYFASEAGIIEVLNYIPHDTQPKYANHLFEKSFSVLGKLHKILWKYHLAEFPPPPAYIFRSIESTLAVFTEAKSRFASLAYSSELDSAINISSQANRLMERLKEESSIRRIELPHTVIHGDFNLTNILFVNSNPKVIIDFDMMGRGERLFELAYLLYSVIKIGGNEHEFKENKAKHYIDFMAHLIKVYEKTSGMPLSDQEKLAFPIMLARVWLNMMALFGAYSDDPIKNLLMAKKDINWSKDLLDNYDYYTDLVSRKLC